MKHHLQEPVRWNYRFPVRDAKGLNPNISFYGIEYFNDVVTLDGTMKMVRIRHKVELADPSINVAAMVAVIDLNCPQPPEIWYWEDKFWLQGIGKDGLPYYRNKHHVLYEIQVNNPTVLLSNFKIVY